MGITGSPFGASRPPADLFGNPVSTILGAPKGAGWPAPNPFTAMPPPPTQAPTNPKVPSGVTPGAGYIQSPTNPTTYFQDPKGPWGPGPGAAGASPTSTPSSAFDGSLASVQSALDAGGWGPGGDPNYWVQRIAQTGGATPDNLAYWKARIAAGPGSPQYAESGGSPFSDPATSPWATLVKQLTDKLTQPVQNPNLQPLLDYASKYFQQLQGPAYTPDQLQLYKTAAVDPITQQRDAQRQTILQHFAAQGIGPSSGIVQSAMLNNDRNAQQLDTQAQSQLALNAIGTQKQQLAQAMGVGQTLAGILPSVQQTNEQRALTGVNLMSQIPALADSRLAAANQTLGAGNLNASSLIQLLMQAQGSGAQNSQAFWQQLGQLLGGLA